MGNDDYYRAAQTAPATPKSISEHQSAVERLEESIGELGKHLSLLVQRLEPVSDLREPASKAPEIWKEPALPSVPPPAHPVPAIRDLDRLESYVAEHLRIVRAAIDRLAI
jgi:hypothetical protein